jgi:hypothetical protein
MTWLDQMIASGVTLWEVKKVADIDDVDRHMGRSETAGRPLPRVFTYDEIREWILWARRKQMTSGPDVAEFLGISATRVNEVERGEKPKMLPATRRKITERIMDENPEWTPSKITFPPLHPDLQQGLLGLTDKQALDEILSEANQSTGESPSFSHLPEGEEASPDSPEPGDSHVRTDYPGAIPHNDPEDRPKISGQMIAIEVDEDDIFELTIQVRRRRRE